MHATIEMVSQEVFSVWFAYITAPLPSSSYYYYYYHYGCYYYCYYYFIKGMPHGQKLE
jgi:hypothetical protein